MSNKVPPEYHSRFTVEMPAPSPMLLLAGGACFVLAFLFRRERWARWLILAGGGLLVLAFLL